MHRGREKQDSPGTPAAKAADRQKNTGVIYVTFFILTLDLSMMFLQFSVTPVSMLSEADISVQTVNRSEWEDVRVFQIWSSKSKQLHNIMGGLL